MMYSKGDRVFHKGLNKYGVVERAVNAGDHEDIKAQGERYEVQFGYGAFALYSVLGKNLILKTRPGK